MKFILPLALLTATALGSGITFDFNRLSTRATSSSCNAKAKQGPSAFCGCAVPKSCPGENPVVLRSCYMDNGNSISCDFDCPGEPGGNCKCGGIAGSGYSCPP